MLTFNSTLIIIIKHTISKCENYKNFTLDGQILGEKLLIAKLSNVSVLNLGIYLIPASAYFKSSVVVKIIRYFYTSWNGNQ